MTRWLRLSVLTGALLLAVVAMPAVAQERPAPRDSSAKPRSPADTAMMFAALDMMSDRMGPMYQSMMEALLEGTLRALEKPENVERMAVFARRYFDALLKQGFTREEALHIVAGTSVVPRGPSN